MEQDTDDGWPAFFPENCPPAAAGPASGRAYRFVRNDPPLSIDFKSYKEAGTTYQGAECEACSLSLLRNLDDIRYMRKAIPGMKKRYVAIGELRTGVVQHTPSRFNSHHSWWLPVHATVEGDFAVIELDEAEM